jgi:glycosyltransferase involved in cell wall biosynthesis
MERSAVTENYRRDVSPNDQLDTMPGTVLFLDQDKRACNKVSVVIPTFNEEKVIGRVVSRVIDVLENSDFDYEVIVVDDGSQDRTQQEAHHAGATVLQHPYNIGNGASVKRGIRHASGDVVVLMDGDGQHDLEEIFAIRL